MKFLLTGATGFVGGELRENLLKEGHVLRVLTRNPKKHQIDGVKNEQFVSWDDNLVELMNDTDVVINLVGENVFGERWDEEVKQRIYDSRILNTRKLVDAIAEADNKPSILVSASGSGYYGNQGDTKLDESFAAGDDFLAGVTVDWEKEALKAEEHGVRVVIPRIGVVLEKGGGALEKMIPPFQFGVGGPISDGKQYMSWIHRSDLVKAILFAIGNEKFSGPFNAVGPSPVTMNEFSERLAKAMHRPAFFRVPEFAVKIMFGEGAKPILDSIRAYPKALLDAGFSFDYEELDEALSAIF